MTDNMLFAILGIGGYLLGSIPFGLILCYVAGYGDIRKIGSGNIGATNVLRTGNKTLALLTVLFDAFKAGIAAYIAKTIVPETPFNLWGAETNLSTLAALISGCCAILGHNFPVWLKFKGGKGVASSFGLVLILTPKVALIALLIWIVTACLFKYSSLAAIVAATLTPVVTYFTENSVYMIFYLMIVILLLVRHHANFARLFKGQESKIKFKK
ncbi:MAG: glycerol-3-phosphate 1-O-acyltransferase PlsY [Alphaproteobacteria bacterium]|nr:glycerol-3-phosphate 1-O-acyltransferase PlsY [Alphaproteobacteria bacterium]